MKKNQSKLPKKLVMYCAVISIIFILVQAINLNDISAKSAVIINTKTNETLYSKNGNARMYPASTTKVLTALTALDYLRPSDVIYVENEVYMVSKGSSTAGLYMGETITVKDLIYALMLPSGNDAAQVLATHAARKAFTQDLNRRAARDKFVDLMNKKAKALGAKNSNFTTVDGFHDSEHFSTANDLALITKEALKNTFLCNVVKTTKHTVGRHEDWINTNELLQKDSKWFTKNVTGFKTGYTTAAGHCLIVTLSKNNQTYIIVLLNSSEDYVFDDAKKLINKQLS